MTIQTRPVFYYVDEITETSNLLNFSEPNIAPDELAATLDVGSRSMTDLMTEIEKGLNDAGDQDYTVTLDRDTRFVTISSSDVFDLYPVTGSNTGLSAFSLIGFTTDRTGLSSYESDVVMGGEYSPQFYPQSYKSFENNIENVQASVNESASGIIEVLSFGQRRFMEMNITFITNRPQSKSAPIENNPNAMSETRSFLTFLITKSNLEYMEDRDNRSTFDKILLESTKQSRQGTAFQLNELVNKGFEEFFETGTLKFRKVE